MIKGDKGMGITAPWHENDKNKDLEKKRMEMLKMRQGKFKLPKHKLAHSCHPFILSRFGCTEQS